MRTLSHSEPKGKVIKNLPLDERAVTIPASEPFRLEGGRQIDPYLLVAAEKQELQKRVAELLDRERKLKEELESLRAKFVEEQKKTEAELREAKEKLEKEAMEAKEEEKKKGFEEGYKDGLKKAYEEVEKRVKEEYKQRFQNVEKQLVKAVETLQKNLDDEIERCSPIMVEIWKALLQRLLRKEIDLDEQLVLRVFKEIMAKVSDRRRVRLFVNPKDKDLFLKKSEEMAEIKRVIEEFELIGDATIEKGSCMVETNLGVYDARWKTQLEAIEREIQSLMGESLHVP
ncbi:MAG: Flagellar assembly protein FliH/Type III secretion system HrpE [Thermovirga lienii]|nr:MAG: Flagellar assembly protein FliH/Type III secretion system HrpE [Thermovirga lienii]